MNNRNQNMPLPNFPGIERPALDFGPVRDQRRALPDYFDVDLSTARSFAAGTALINNVAGNVLFIDQNDDTGGKATIYFQDTTNKSTPVSVHPGSIFTVPFTGLAIENTAQPGKVMRVIYGVDIQFQPSLSLGGTVQVIDGGKSRVVTGQSFLDTVVVAAVAAQYPHVSITNPAGSGKNIFINQLFLAVEGTVSGLLAIRQNDVILANDTTAANSFSKRNGEVFVGGHKLSWESNVAVLGTPGWGGRYYLTPTSPPLIMRYTEPLCLTPGNGMVVGGNVANMSIAVSVEGYEEVA